MSVNNNNESETPIGSEFSKLNLVAINHDNCYPSCKECVLLV